MTRWSHKHAFSPSRVSLCISFYSVLSVINQGAVSSSLTTGDFFWVFVISGGDGGGLPSCLGRVTDMHFSALPAYLAPFFLFHALYGVL